MQSYQLKKLLPNLLHFFQSSSFLWILLKSFKHLRLHQSFKYIQKFCLKRTQKPRIVSFWYCLIKKPMRNWSFPIVGKLKNWNFVQKYLCLCLCARVCVCVRVFSCDVSRWFHLLNFSISKLISCEIRLCMCVCIRAMWMDFHGIHVKNFIINTFWFYVDK